jgi:NADPH:quinone reductase
MQAITYTEFGPAAEVLKLEEVASREPAQGEVVVDLIYSGVNPSDVKARAGTRPGVTRPPWPRIIPHSDGAGMISAVGVGVSSDRIGQRVWIWNGQWQRPFGTAAEQITLPSDQAVPLPESVSLQTGATLGIPGLTASHCVFQDGSVNGQTVLIHGGAGSVGNLAVQLAKWGGAHVIATAGIAGQDRAMQAGADTVLDYRSLDLAAKILLANNGCPVDRIIEVELGSNIDCDAEVIAENGTICAYGSAKNMAPVLSFGPLLFKAVTLKIALVYILTPQQRDAATKNLTEAMAQGALSSGVDRIFALGDCAKAHAHVETGGRAGATLVQIRPDPER